MNTNLITYDMDNFINKYTRFMTKDIYINNKLYQNFLNQYNYLYQELENKSILFRENIKYKKIINIKENQTNLLKLHNQKYLKKALLKYQPFFEELNYDNLLDNNKKAIILADEDKLLVISDKCNKELIISKIKFLTKYEKIKEEKIMIITNEIDENTKKLLIDMKLSKVTYNSLDYYKNTLLVDKRIVNNKEKYSILFEYLTKKLFPNKNKFKELYNAFSNNIYLNKDYEEFETFKDYHNYIYKKVYLTSNLPLKKYNEKEIEKRKNYLRTIDNSIMNSKKEVDIANFLYLNSINYKYENNSFIIENNDKVSYISFDKKDDEHDNIYLEMKDLFGNNYVEKLIYELIKRRYPLELISDEEIYNILKESTINNYFSEFINKYLIPLLDHYDKSKNFNNTNLNDLQKKLLIDIYNYYKTSLDDNNLMTDNNFKNLLENNLNKYKYLIIDGDINIEPETKILKIIPDYRENQLLKENIKLTYDYKKYLIDNSALPIKNAFNNLDELEQLTEKFQKEQLKEIEKSGEFLNKKINIYLYDDNNRLLINKSISKLCLEIIKTNKKSIIVVNNKKQIDNLILKNYFSKHSPIELIDTNNNIIEYKEIKNLKNKHNTIILPFLINDSYHDSPIIKNEFEDIKINIYTILNKCQNNLIILCPKSKEETLKKNLKKIKNIKFNN